MEEKQEQNKINIQELESHVEESFMKGDKPYRKVPRNFVKPVFCHDCKTMQNLILITEERKSSFKRATHKKNRNRIPLLTPNGEKVYLCKDCLIKRAKKVKQQSK